MCVVREEHLWKRGDSPSSQGGTGEVQPSPGCNVHLPTPKPTAAGFSTLAADGLQVTGWRVLIWVATVQQGRHLGPRMHLQKLSPLGQSHHASNACGLCWFQSCSAETSARWTKPPPCL